MDMSRRVLACWGCSPPVLDLARGMAVNLDLELRDVSSSVEIRSLNGADPSIVIMAASMLSESLLATVKSESSLIRAWFILLVSNASSEDEDRALEAGAIACLDPNQALMRLAHFIRNLLRCVRFEADSTPTELCISGDVILRISENILINRQRSYHLAPITGRLLECLANRADALTPSDELKRSAWGTPDGATDHALHQQMRRVRDALDEFCMGDRLKCLRGKGYVLARAIVGE